MDFMYRHAVLRHQGEVVRPIFGFIPTVMISRFLQTFGGIFIHAVALHGAMRRLDNAIVIRYTHIGSGY
jgi:drug/metabolite transporter superfamily protein YnfA